jgi:TusA-related sulfurtransferase
MREQLDARRLLCPMPVIRVQDRVKELPEGVELEAYCTDPGVFNDIPAWCRINGHTVVETRQEDGDYIVVIRVGRQNP